MSLPYGYGFQRNPKQSIELLKRHTAAMQRHVDLLRTGRPEDATQVIKEMQDASFERDMARMQSNVDRVRLPSHVFSAAVGGLAGGLGGYGLSRLVNSRKSSTASQRKRTSQVKKTARASKHRPRR
jgi:pentatricopeptide repeat protein